MNQLLDSSISLSPPNAILQIDLHVRTCMDLHQSFLWLHPDHVKFAIFRVPTCTLYLRPRDNAHGTGLWCAATEATDPISATRGDLYFHFAFRFLNPMTRVNVRLLGPCFKTGRMGNRLNIRARHHSPSPRTITPSSQGQQSW